MHKTCHVLFALMLATTASLTASAQVGLNEVVLNPNRSGEEQLLEIEHIDQSLANRIVAGRM